MKSLAAKGEMQSGSALADEIRRVLLTALSIRVDSPEAELLESGILDSLMLTRLIERLERQFGIELGLDTVGFASFRSVSAIAQTVEAQQASRRDAGAR